jgi:hypothetical protein
MSWPPSLTGLPLAQVRRVQGAADVALDRAKAIRANASSLRELLAAAEVVVFYETIIAACRCEATRRKRLPPWRAVRVQGVGRGRPQGPRPPRIAALLRFPALQSRMGHGRPASSCAGSAAGSADQGENAEPVQSETARLPAKPAFFGPPDERISKENNTVGGIHYANYDWA